MIRKLAIAVLATLGTQAAIAGDFNLDAERLSGKTMDVKAPAMQNAPAADKYEFLWKYSN